MSSKEGEEKELVNQRIQIKFQRRKEKLQNIISKKRLSQTYQKEEPSQIKETLQEEIEVIHEEEGETKIQNLSGCRKHFKRRSKKRCWNCRSKSHQETLPIYTMLLLHEIWTYETTMSPKENRQSIELNRETRRTKIKKEKT